MLGGKRINCGNRQKISCKRASKRCKWSTKNENCSRRKSKTNKKKSKKVSCHFRKSKKICKKSNKCKWSNKKCSRKKRCPWNANQEKCLKGIRKNSCEYNKDGFYNNPDYTCKKIDKLIETAYKSDLIDKNTRLNLLKKLKQKKETLVEKEYKKDLEKFSKRL